MSNLNLRGKVEEVEEAEVRIIRANPEFQALLRVARAAKIIAAQVELAREPDKPLGQSPIVTDDLLEALKEVADLLALE